VLAGPNGAGKSTVGPELIRDVLAVDEFVNADVIARGLSAFDPEGVAIAAGRVMLQRLRALARQRVSFAFETTLASRSFAPGSPGWSGRAMPFTSSFSGSPASTWRSTGSPIGSGSAGTAFPTTSFAGGIARDGRTSSGYIGPWRRPGGYTTIP
jgi:hypothetical protein